MYIQIKMYQREAAYRKHSLGKQNRDTNASLRMALGIFILERSHPSRTRVFSRLRLP